MPFLDVDSHKLAYLISFGTREGELQRFFKDRHKLLLLRGAHKLRNPPGNRKDRIDWLARRLPKTTDEVVREYFEKHITVEPLETVDEILEWFRVFNDDGGEGLPADDARRLARSALVHLFAPSPDDRLVAYLRQRPLRPETSVTKSGADASAQPSGLQPKTDLEARGPTLAAEALTSKLPIILSAAAFGQSAILQDAASDLPPDTQTFIDGLLSARAGNLHDLEAAISTLPPTAVERHTLEGLRGRAQMGISPRSADADGLSVVDPLWFDGQPPETFEIVGIAVKEFEQVLFVKPLALKVGDTWTRLTETDRLRLFPLSGDAMTHRGSGKRIPQVGEYVNWLIEHSDRSTGRTRYHLADETNRLYEVLEVAAPSTEPDDVRAEINALVSRRPSTQPLLFALGDGLVVAPKTSTASREEAFDTPWHAWPGASVISLDGRLLHFGSPVAAPSQIDLAPLELVAKRAIRSLVDAKKLSLTKKEVAEFADQLRSDELGLVHSRTKRLLRQVEAIELDMEAVEQLKPLALARPEITKQVEAYVDAETRRRLEARDSILAEIESAKLRRAQLQNDVKAYEQRLQQLQSTTSTAVDSAFRTAIENGLQTLSQAAIFRQLTLPAWPYGSAPSSERAPLRLLTRSQDCGLDDNAVLLGLKEIGLPRTAGLTALLALKAARQMRLALLVSGPMARHTARVLARHGDGLALVIDIPLGFSDVVEFSLALEANCAVKAVCVLNADAAPFEMYGAPLMDEIVARSVQPGAFRTTVIAHSTEEMVAGISSDLRRFSFALDLGSLSARPGTEGWSPALENLEADECHWHAAAVKRLASWARELDVTDAELLNVAISANLKTVQR